MPKGHSLSLSLSLFFFFYTSKCEYLKTKTEVVLVQSSISGPALYYKVCISGNRQGLSFSWGQPQDQLFTKVWISEKQTMLDWGSRFLFRDVNPGLHGAGCSWVAFLNPQIGSKLGCHNPIFPGNLTYKPQSFLSIENRKLGRAKSSVLNSRVGSQKSTLCSKELVLRLPSEEVPPSWGQSQDQLFTTKCGFLRTDRVVILLSSLTGPALYYKV